jgi:hypothetical protein
MGAKQRTHNADTRHLHLLDAWPGECCDAHTHARHCPPILRANPIATPTAVISRLNSPHTRPRIPSKAPPAPSPSPSPSLLFHLPPRICLWALSPPPPPPKVSPFGDAHGHGPYPITNGERTLLSAWLKQGRDWLML